MNAIKIAMNPYKPALDCTAPTTATIGGGDSLYVGGIQVCSGHTGVFIKNAKAKPGKDPRRPRADQRRARLRPITSVEP